MIEVYHYIGLFLIVLGSIFLFLGGLGIYRMPDLYDRLQAGTKASTLGAMSLILGVGFLQMAQVMPDGSLQTNWLVKAIILVVFIALSNPISSHALARGAYKNGIKPLIKGGDDYDAYKEQFQTEKEEDKA